VRMIDITQQWQSVCPATQLSVGRGVAALIDGVAIALFCSPSGEIRALSNVDPASGASVMSRGLVGSHGDIVFVASPMFKHRFDLATGECLDHPDYRLAVFAVRVVDGMVEVTRS
jgi:nitrite reductase (NADH) small subunit